MSDQTLANVRESIKTKVDAWLADMEKDSGKRNLTIIDGIARTMRDDGFAGLGNSSGVRSPVL